MTSSPFGPVTGAVVGLLGLDGQGNGHLAGSAPDDEPVPVAAGSLGTWSGDEG